MFRAASNRCWRWIPLCWWVPLPCPNIEDGCRHWNEKPHRWTKDRESFNKMSGGRTNDDDDDYSGDGWCLVMHTDDDCVSSPWWVADWTVNGVACSNPSSRVLQCQVWALAKWRHSVGPVRPLGPKVGTGIMDILIWVIGGHLPHQATGHCQAKCAIKELKCAFPAVLDCDP